jgi:hypothetical protein
MKGMMKNLGAAVGVALLLGACEKDIPAGGGEGAKVPVIFSINTTNYSIEDEVVRSGGTREPATTSISLNDDLFLQATLTPDPEEEELRAAAFIDGQKLCFAAFKNDGTQEGATAVYTYSTSTGKWSSSAPLGVVPDGTTTSHLPLTFILLKNTVYEHLTGVRGLRRIK